MITKIQKDVPSSSIYDISRVLYRETTSRYVLHATDNLLTCYWQLINSCLTASQLLVFVLAKICQLIVSSLSGDKLPIVFF